MLAKGFGSKNSFWSVAITRQSWGAENHIPLTYLKKRHQPHCDAVSLQRDKSGAHPQRRLNFVGNLSDDIGNHHVEHHRNQEGFEVIEIQCRR